VREMLRNALEILTLVMFLLVLLILASVIGDFLNPGDHLSTTLADRIGPLMLTIVLLAAGVAGTRMMDTASRSDR